MSHRDRDSRHIGRNLALFGGTALLFWLLLRGKGRGWGLSAGGDVGLGGAGAGANATPTSTEATAPCRVWIRADRIDLDGTPADLPTVVAHCRASGRADVYATGDAIVRTIGEVVREIQATGIVVNASPAVWLSVAASPLTRTP
jgi:hypothetical protein